MKALGIGLVALVAACSSPALDERVTDGIRVGQYYELQSDRVATYEDLRAGIQVFQISTEPMKRKYFCNVHEHGALAVKRFESSGRDTSVVAEYFPVDATLPEGMAVATSCPSWRDVSMPLVFFRRYTKEYVGP